MAWKIWLMALFFQVSARIKEREEKILCLAEMGSLDLASWMEAVYIDVHYFSSLSTWFGGLPCLYRTRCQLEPPLAMIYVYKAYCLLVLQQCKWPEALDKFPSSGALRVCFF